MCLPHTIPRLFRRFFLPTIKRFATFPTTSSRFLFESSFTRHFYNSRITREMKEESRERRNFPKHEERILLTNEIVLYEIVCVLSPPLATLLDEIRGSVSSVAVIFPFCADISILQPFSFIYSFSLLTTARTRVT